MSSTVIQWILDTRHLWPEAKETKDLAKVASRAMSLLSASEQSAVLKYYFVKDAKMSLGSSLLKRFAIARFCGVSWASATAGRDERTKPVFYMPEQHQNHQDHQHQNQEQQSQPLLFNISHQAGLVVLFAVHLPPPGLDIGVDVVCVGERSARDLSMVRRDGWSAFVGVHEDVFSPLEARRLRDLERTTTVHERLRHFYALWCVREGYVKMTGEALLAPWLADLDMRCCEPPPADDEDYNHDADHERLQVWFRGERREDVRVSIKTVERLPEDDGYMICTVVRQDPDAVRLRLRAFDMVDLDDVVVQAEELKQHHPAS